MLGIRGRGENDIKGMLRVVELNGVKISLSGDTGKQVVVIKELVGVVKQVIGKEIKELSASEIKGVMGYIEKIGGKKGLLLRIVA